MLNDVACLVAIQRSLMVSLARWFAPLTMTLPYIVYTEGRAPSTEIPMPSNDDIAHHQKLLAMYRGLLAEYLRQRELWDRTQIPDFLRAGIAILRDNIVKLKGLLRGWNVAIDDHPNDEGPNDDLAGQVQHQRNLLKIHRRNLATYLRQQEQFPENQAPIAIVNSIQNTRDEIQRIKAILRGWNVPVDDVPGEE
jgi:hypothetical protein